MAEHGDNWVDQVEFIKEIKINLGDYDQPNTPNKHEIQKRWSSGRPAKEMTTKKDGTEEELNIFHPHDVNGDN